MTTVFDRYECLNVWGLMRNQVGQWPTPFKRTDPNGKIDVLCVRVTKDDRDCAIVLKFSSLQFSPVCWGRQSVVLYYIVSIKLKYSVPIVVYTLYYNCLGFVTLGRRWSNVELCRNMSSIICVPMCECICKNIGFVYCAARLYIYFPECVAFQR